MEENPKIEWASKLYYHYYELVKHLNNINIVLELCSISLVIATLNENRLIDIYATNASVFFLLSFILSPISKVRIKYEPPFVFLKELPAVFTGFGLISLILIVYEYARNLNMIDKIGKLIIFFMYSRFVLLAIVCDLSLLSIYIKKYNALALKVVIFELIATYAIGIILMFLSLCISIGSFLVVGWDLHIDLYLLEGISNASIFYIGVIIVFINMASSDTIKTLCKSTLATGSQRMFKIHSAALLIGVSLFYFSSIFHYIGGYVNETILQVMSVVGFVLIIGLYVIYKCVPKYIQR